jgi:hypothetical protein
VAHGFFYTKPDWHRRHVHVVHKPVHVHQPHIVPGKWRPQKHVVAKPYVRVPESQRRPIVQSHTMPAASGFSHQKREFAHKQQPQPRPQVRSEPRPQARADPRPQVRAEPRPQARAQPRGQAPVAQKQMGHQPSRQFGNGGGSRSQVGNGGGFRTQGGGGFRGNGNGNGGGWRPRG